MTKRMIKILAIVLLILVLLFGAYHWFMRGQILDFITNTPEEIKERVGREWAEGRFYLKPSELDLPYEDVTVTNASGMRLNGWYIPSSNGAVVMLQHGWQELPYHMLEEAEMLHRHGYGSLLTSVRAHNFSDGEVASFGCKEMEDLDAFYQYLLTREDIDANRIGILGQSMGGSLVIQYAHENENIQALVSHSAFSSMPDVFEIGIKNNFPWIPHPFVGVVSKTMVFWMERELECDIRALDSKTWIHDISPRPVYIIDAELDTVVNRDGGELLFTAAGEPKEFWQCAGSEHHECDTDYPQEFEERVVRFFDRTLLGRD